MSELPRTEDLPLDAERVEEAFSSFAERVRELESVADELRAELRALRAQRIPAVALDDEEEWPAEPGLSSAGLAPAPDWVGSVSPPLARPTATPRLVLEGVFLLVVALLAGLADLSAAWIVLVMAAAWALVALSEWSSAGKHARWRLEEIAAPAAGEAGTVDDTTGPWDMPVVGATVVEAPDESESRTVIAKLPDEPERPDDQPAVEPAAKPRRGLRFWRRASVEPAPDPWEA